MNTQDLLVRFQSGLLGDWKVVTVEEAQKSQLYGFGGWLLLFYLWHWYPIAEQLFAFAAPSLEITRFFGQDAASNSAQFSQEELLMLYGLQVPFLAGC